MKVTANNWQSDVNNTLYKAASLGDQTEKEGEKISDSAKENDFDRLSDSLEALSNQSPETSGGDFKMKSSRRFCGTACRRISQSRDKDGCSASLF